MQIMKRSLAFLLIGVMAFGLVTMVQAQDSIHVDLDKALEIALSESPTMRIADRTVDIKREYKKEQLVSLFPDVSVVGNYNRTLLKQTMSMDMGGQTMNIKVGRDNTYSVLFGQA